MRSAGSGLLPGPARIEPKSVAFGSMPATCGGGARPCAWSARLGALHRSGSTASRWADGPMGNNRPRQGGPRDGRRNLRPLAVSWPPFFAGRPPGRSQVPGPKPFSPKTERWPSGRRRTPAKGVRVKSPSRVRIPLSPPSSFLSPSHAVSYRLKRRKTARN